MEFDSISISVSYGGPFTLSQPPELGPGDYTQLVFIIILATLGIVGNGGLLMSVCRTKRLRTPANILLTNLALGDLLYIFIAVPFYVEHIINPTWNSSDFVCRARHYLQIVAQGVCVYSLTALSGERYLALVGQSVIRGDNRKKKRTMVVIIIWLASILISLPVPILGGLHIYEDGDVNNGDGDGGNRTFSHNMSESPACYHMPMDSDFTRVYELSRTMAFYILPCIAIGFFYVQIAVTLLRSTDTFAHESQPGVRHFSARKRLALTVIVVDLFFAIFWFPYFCSVCIFAVNQSIGFSMVILTQVFHIASISNSCLNPWVVYVMSSTHRELFFNTLRCRGDNYNRFRTNTQKSNENVEFKQLHQVSTATKARSKTTQDTLW